MTNDILSPADPQIVELFKHGKCLTFDFSQDVKNVSAVMQKTAGRCGRVVCSTAPLALKQDTQLAFFADGTLIPGRYTSAAVVARFAAVAQKLGYAVKLKEGNFEWRFLTAVNDYARATLDPDELCFEPLPSQENFVNALFDGGNICLTAGREEKIDPACRSFLALFADGRLIVSDLYKTNRYGIYDYRKVSQFTRAYPDYLYLQPQYVPQSYLDALYCRAERYGWYISVEEAAAAMPVQTLPTTEESAAGDAFVKEIFKDRRCISVAPRELSLINRYALFDDGTLVMADDVPDYAAADIEKELTKHFPGLELKIQQAPQSFIDAVYRKLPQMQKSAKQVYLEILKQKARKLRKKLNFPHHQALETVAQMAGWQSWKQATRIDEERAKFVLVSEKNKKELAAVFGQDPLEMEYKEYLKRQRE